MNNVSLLGRLTDNPELKRTNIGKTVTQFTLAINRSYNKELVDFINIVAWNATAEFICKYFVKGQMIGLQGEIQTRTYDDKYGNKRKVFEVRANNVYFAGRNKANMCDVDFDINNDIDLEVETDYSDEDLPF